MGEGDDIWLEVWPASKQKKDSFRAAVERGVDCSLSRWGSFRGPLVQMGGSGEVEW